MKMSVVKAAEARATAAPAPTIASRNRVSDAVRLARATNAATHNDCEKSSPGINRIEWPCKRVTLATAIDWTTAGAPMRNNAANASFDVISVHGGIGRVSQNASAPT